MKNKLLNLAIVSALFAYGELTVANEKQPIGWIEPVSIDNGALTLLAKIDTGADGSSLNAKNIYEFNKNGVKWVSFVLVNYSGEKHKVIKPVQSYVYIKRNGEPSQRRPVILLDICLDKKRKEMKVNLVDRGKYKYQMLIGRRFLKGSFLVDAGRKKATKPKCEY